MALLLSKLLGTLMETLAYGIMYQFCIYRKKDSRPRLGVFFAFIYGLLMLLDFTKLSHTLLFSGLLIVMMNSLLKYDIKISGFFAVQSYAIMLSSKLMVALGMLYFKNEKIKVEGFWESGKFFQMTGVVALILVMCILIKVLHGHIKKKVGISRRSASFQRWVIFLCYLEFILGGIFLYSFSLKNWNAITKIPGLGMLILSGFSFLTLAVAIIGYLGVYNLCFRYQYVRVSQMAENDPLTGLMSRNAGMNFLRKAFNQARASGQRLTIAFVDVNDLKVVNDKFGHNAGDHLLERISDVIKSNIRDTDGALRFGGDEFILVLQDCPQYRAEEIMTQINVYLNRYNLSGELGFKIAISYGLVEYNKMRHNNALDMISDADTEMYKNKKKQKQPNMSSNR